MARVADLDIAGAGDGRVRVDEFDRIEKCSAVVALIAAGFLVAAIGACTFDVAVRQEALVVDRVDLFRGALVDQAVILKDVGEVLRQAAVGFVGGAAEPVEGEVEAGAYIFLDVVLLGAVVGHALARLDGGEFCRRAVLVGGADEEHFVPGGSAIARIDIRREHRAGKVAEMLDAVDVGQGGCDEDTCHARDVAPPGIDCQPASMISLFRRAIRTGRILG